MISKVLVANRGEIAIRAFRAAYELGMGTKGPSLRRRRRPIKVAQAMPEPIGDELARRPGDVQVQDLDGGTGVTGKGQVLQFAMLGQQVAIMITHQRPVPLAVQFGAVTQALDDRLQARVVTSGHQSVMEVAVWRYPLLVGHRCAFQNVKSGDNTRLPLDVAAFDRQPQSHRFDFDPQFGQRNNISHRQLTDAKTSLGGRDYQAPFAQPGQRLTNNGLADPETSGQFDHSEFLPRPDGTVEQLGEYDIVDLFSTRGRSSAHLDEHNVFRYF